MFNLFKNGAHIREYMWSDFEVKGFEDWEEHGRTSFTQWEEYAKNVKQIHLEGMDLLFVSTEPGMAAELPSNGVMTFNPVGWTPLKSRIDQEIMDEKVAMYWHVIMFHPPVGMY